MFSLQGTGNREKRKVSREQRAESREQRAESRGHEPVSSEQRAESKDREKRAWGRDQSRLHVAPAGQDVSPVA